ncbi:hypothetical protein BDZ45DRAFT_668438 [Acephala macrosclerotiorum]|nr:hypothetical protein BDZ45DRAFT_668438 [Acephala macrosclerotiorum]
MEVKDLYTERVDTTENVADVLTKALGPKKFKYFMGKMGLVDMKHMDSVIGDMELKVDEKDSGVKG